MKCKSIVFILTGDRRGYYETIDNSIEAESYWPKLCLQGDINCCFL